MTKLAYLQRSLSSQFTPSRFACPSCNSSDNHVVDRKFLVTQLRRCHACGLMFRTPTDYPGFNATYYEDEYTQGFTTDIPSDAKLNEMKRCNFAGTEKSYSYYISVLTELGLKPGDKIFDYGCSWGYGSYQFAQAGFDVMSFEVAGGRRRFARDRLDVVTVDNMERAVTDVALAFDCFFSAHVIEHVPSPAQAFDYAWQLLKQDGLFVSFTPNGSSAHRIASPSWSKLWGEVHPNFIDEIFLDRAFRLSPRVIGSSPVISASIPDGVAMKRLDCLDRDELFFAARKSGSAWG